MTDQLTIHMLQGNPVVGDIAGNAELVRAARAEAAKAGCDILVTPELFLIGYPPEDLVKRPSLQADAMAMVKALAKETADGGPAVVLGTPWADEGKLYNSVAVLDGGKIEAVRHKVELPNYGVFDEKRVFDAGPMPGPVNIRGVRIGLPICEDIWFPAVTECLEETGAELLLVPNGSPFTTVKSDERISHAVARVRESGLPLAYVNQLGGQDDLVFDGASFVLNADLSVAVQAPAWLSALIETKWTREGSKWVCAPGDKARVESDLEAIYCAVTLGLKDYVEKNRFPGVVLGLSGGIDSALSAAIAVDALGADKVWCVMLPSRYTSKASLDDAEACAKALGVRYDTVKIEEAVDAFGHSLAPLFANRAPDLTEENIQSRTRGLILMALSNKFGPMVLTTGNKSEVSVGYATLYGDMCGGYNALKDLYKMQVFALSRWRNTAKPVWAKGPDGLVIPEAIIEKPPTAELREDQKDEDSLPPYSELDDILTALVDEELSIAETVARGHAPETVKRIQHLVYLAEYKRRQAAPGPKIGTRNFGRDRRYPITNRYRNDHA